MNIWNGLAIHAKTGYLHDENINTLTDQVITNKTNNNAPIKLNFFNKYFKPIFKIVQKHL